MKHKDKKMYDLIASNLQSAGADKVMMLGRVGKAVIKALFKNVLIESVAYTKNEHYIFTKRKPHKFTDTNKSAATPQAPPQLFNNIASAALSLLRAIYARKNNDLEWFTRELKCEHDKLEYVIKDAKEKLGIVD